MRCVPQRWDPCFWQGRTAVRRLAGRLRLVPLGEYICHLTYGPIVTGQPSSARRGRGAGHPAGRHCRNRARRPRTFVRRAEPERTIPARSRVRPGDLLLPRSGAGALGRNRLAVYMGSGPANVGCFVDLIRLEGLNPFYAWFFFKTRLGREQIAAYANGVGTPNISFGEIRALQIRGLALVLSECPRKVLSGASVASALSERECGNARRGRAALPRHRRRSRRLLADATAIGRGQS